MTKAEITEAVARALCARHYAERFKTLPSDPHVQMNVDGNWYLWKGDADTAILALLRAIREPSFAMRRAADERTGTGDPYADIYTTMIDTLLAEFDADSPAPPATEAAKQCSACGGTRWLRGSHWHGEHLICIPCFMIWYDGDAEDPTNPKSVGEASLKAKAAGEWPWVGKFDPATEAGQPEGQP